MAWALKNSDNSAVAVSLVRDHLQPLHNHMLVEIDDDLAHRVMTGETPLHSVFGLPVTLSSATAPPIPRRPRTTDRYPAIMSDNDVRVLGNLASMLSPGSTVVEIGSRLGGSARVMLDSMPSIKRLYCIDDEWQYPENSAMNDPAMAEIIQRWDVARFGSCFAFARHYLSGHPSARLLAKSSPYDLSWWSEQVDMVFEDSSHANPQLTSNIWFWWKHLRPGGIMSGHDYGNARYPDVKSSVHAFCETVDVQYRVESSIWWVTKPW